ncbi:MAG: NAD(+)/NADH kinase [Phycisphaerales bacterium]|nr:NAD(+)/NADH kinase [Phycisphaerales bacterium]
MSASHGQRRVMIVANREKPGVSETMQRLKTFAQTRASVVGAFDSLNVEAALRDRPDRLVVLGGDGTLIGVARSLGAAQLPLIGVNMGKLGFLAEFSPEELCDQFDRAMSDDRCISRRMMLEVTHARPGRSDGAQVGQLSELPRVGQLSELPKAGTPTTRHGTDRSLLAVNDCVFQMGPPFRMISLHVAIDGEHLTHIRGDGLAVCTPNGSTAHSLSAGGPVMAADLSAIGITPLNAHSLTHRPIVVGPDSVIEVRPEAVNSGSSLIIDGQATISLAEGDVVRIRRAPAEFQLVRNPRHSPWHNLVTKLHWGQPPAS